jgi:hypothetical protein
MEDFHLGITEQFENGMISIRRTNKSFSWTPIDLVVEQTINAEATNRSRVNMYSFCFLKTPLLKIYLFYFK